MGKRGWGGICIAGLLVFALAPSVRAQDASRDKELDELKKRVEALEQEKAKQKEALEKDMHGADPVEEKWYDRVTVGGGVRADFRIIERAAPDQFHTSNRFELDDARIYVNAKVTENISAELNTALSSGGAAGLGDVNILDAIVKFHLQDECNIWMGRMLPPSGRSNLDGPFYLLTWDFPTIVERYPSIFDGRENGAGVWGDLMDKKLKYYVGVFNGNEGNAINRTDNLLYAGRFTYNLWDPEPAPFYYTASTYYGAKDILAISVVGQYQRGGGPGSAADPEPFRSGDVEVFFEKKFPALGDGVVTAEAAIYKYYLGSEFAGTGTAYLAQVGYLFDEKIGWGKFQPHIRWQKFDDSGAAANLDTVRYDIGVNYVISSHNARISLVWSEIVFDPNPGLPDRIVRELTLGTQVQF